MSAERAQDRGESPEDTGRTSQDNCTVEGSSSDSVGGRAARTNAVLFNTRICSGPPAGRRAPRPCSHRMSPRSAERLSHVHMALLERGEYWGTCVTGLLSRCTASLAGEQDGCDVDKRRHPPGVGRLVGGGNWWRIMDEPSAQPPDLLMPLCIFLRPVYPKLSQHELFSLSQQFVSLSLAMRTGLDAQPLVPRIPHSRQNSKAREQQPQQ